MREANSSGVFPDNLEAVAFEPFAYFWQVQRAHVLAVQDGDDGGRSSGGSDGPEPAVSSS